MAVERGDSSASVGATVDDSPSTFEQSTLKGTTTTGNARLIVRDATQIAVIDTYNYWASNTVEGVLDEIANLTGLGSHVQDQIDAIVIRVTDNEADIATNVINIAANAANILSNDGDISALDGRVTTNEADVVLLYAADVTLQDNIDTEEAARIAADSAIQADVDANEAASDAADALRVLKAGDTMTGHLLGITPTADTHLTRKDYVDGYAMNTVSVPAHLTADPDATREAYILTNHANTPNSSFFWHVHTYFYTSTLGNRAQQAILYNPSGGNTQFWFRSYYSVTGWEAWKQLADMGYVDDNITYETLDTNSDVGTGAGQLAIGNHNHSGVYEPADATILKDADIDVTVTSPTYVDTKAEDEAIAFAIALGG